jgi:hypothetical protein
MAPRPTLKLEDQPLSFVRGCLFDIFSATLHMPPEGAPGCGDKCTLCSGYMLAVADVSLPVVSRTVSVPLLQQLSTNSLTSTF